MLRLLGAALASIALVGCTSTVHPDYHPDVRYSYVQNVTYAQNAYVGAPDANGSGGPAGDPALTAAAAEASKCEPGRLVECVNECFKRSNGGACDLLSAMFELGDKVKRNHAAARRLQERACELGVCGGIGAPSRAEEREEGVSARGPVIIYGGFNGTLNVRTGGP